MDIDIHLEQLLADGHHNDQSATERSSMMLNITRSTGAFLDLLVSDSKPNRILELGTSNGYSTIWLARAAKRVGAVIDTVDVSRQKTELALENLTKCQLNDVVTAHVQDGGEYLKQSDADVYDFIFLDSDRAAYMRWANDLLRVIQFGLLVVDNALSHQDEMADFRRHLRDDCGLDTAVLPIGKGQLIVNARQ